MTYDLQTLGERAAAAFLPPETVDETGWDILLALRSHAQGNLSLEKLSVMASVPQRILNEWLVLLEDRELIAGEKHEAHDELRPILTPGGRQLLNSYLSAASSLHVGAHH